MKTHNLPIRLEEPLRMRLKHREADYWIKRLKSNLWITLFCTIIPLAIFGSDALLSKDKNARLIRAIKASGCLGFTVAICLTIKESAAREISINSNGLAVRHTYLSRISYEYSSICKITLDDKRDYIVVLFSFSDFEIDFLLDESQTQVFLEVMSDTSNKISSIKFITNHSSDHMLEKEEGRKRR